MLLVSHHDSHDEHAMIVMILVSHHDISHYHGVKLIAHFSFTP